MWVSAFPLSGFEPNPTDSTWKEKAKLRVPITTSFPNLKFTNNQTQKLKKASNPIPILQHLIEKKKYV